MWQKKHKAKVARTDELTVWEHVEEVRRVIIVSVVSVFVGGSVTHYFRNEITWFVLRPLKGLPLQFLSPLDSLVFILALDFVGGILLSLPIIVWLLYRFAAPALPRMRMGVVFFVVIAPLVLAGAAALYAYYVAIPITLNVLASFTVPGITVAYTAENYISFFITALLMLMIVFEMPVIMVILTRIGLLNPRVVAHKRRYVYVGLLVAVAIITPTTDLVSLALIIFPTYAVFELGLVGARIVRIKK